MSKVKIERELKKKNIKAINIEYVRSCPTPSGYAKGWDIEFGYETTGAVYLIDENCKIDAFMEFDSINHVMDFIKTIPVLGVSHEL